MLITGGPRRELFTIFMKELLRDETGILKETEQETGKFVITNSMSLLEKQYYFGAGLMSG